MIKNRKINNIAGETHRVALLDESGEFELLIGIDEAGAGANAIEIGDQEDYYESTYGGATRVMVPTKRADDVVKHGRAKAPSVAKIDVEGAEYNVLKGGEEVFQPDVCHTIFCEIHPIITQFGYEMEDIYSLLEKRGYHVELFHEEETTEFVIATC